MDVTYGILIYLLTLGAGFIVQNFTRWSPWVNLGLSFLIIFMVPPSWSLGLINGIWVACAFFTFNPETDRLELLKGFSWLKVFLSSLRIFGGFLLTLCLLWKLKLSGYLLMSQREFIAWSFLVFIEVCQFRVIARLSPVLHRIPLGYGIAFCNFLMLLFWLLPLGIPFMAMVLVTLMIINPLLLVFVDLPIGADDNAYMRRNG